MTENVLHVAIIPDGNRRWARKNALKVWKGHEKGARKIRTLAHAAFEQGVTHLSIWGSSLDNLTKRPRAEREALIAVYMHAVEKLLTPAEHTTLRARIRFCGRWRTFFPPKLIRSIERLEEVTRVYTERTLTVFLVYNGDDEMLDAITRMVKEGANVTAASLKAHLWTHDLPPVDLMIRTGGEPHLSAGFMMWDMANAHLHFTRTLFPDFTPKDLAKALSAFRMRTRRLGA